MIAASLTATPTAHPAPCLPMRLAHPPTLTLRAPGRLHLGFLDPAATLGRRFGSIGLVIDDFETEVELSAGDGLSAASPAAQRELDRAAAHLHALRDHSGRDEPLHLRLVRVLPAHAGFGSGTQLALAVGRAFAAWHGLAVDNATLAQWLGRGLRSGVGIAGFDQGGLLVDGGPGADGRPAPLLARLPLPEPWRVLVVQDSRHQGLSGGAERTALATLSPLPQAAAADICHQTLMRVLPGAANADFAAFAAGVSRIQQVLGEHFAPAQEGRGYTSAAVARLLDALAESSRHGVPAALAGAAIGQSSWGPTGFAILPSQARAEALVDAARATGAVDPALSLRIVRGRNSGHTLTRRVARASDTPQAA